MDDRIAEILRNHILNATQQLELIRNGAKFDGVTDPIPDREAELLVLISKWQAELSRHEERSNSLLP